MEGWMVSAIVSLMIGVITIGSTYGFFKGKFESLTAIVSTQSQTIIILEKFKNEKTPLLTHLSRVEEAYGKKLDYQGKDIIALQTKLANVPTMKEVREEFVSKEVYLQMEKHIDEKFAGLQSGVSEILKKLDTRI